LGGRRGEGRAIEKLGIARSKMKGAIKGHHLPVM